MERGNLHPKGRWCATTKAIHLLLNLQAGSSQQTLKKADGWKETKDQMNCPSVQECKVSTRIKCQSIAGRRAQRVTEEGAEEDLAALQVSMDCPLIECPQKEPWLSPQT